METMREQERADVVVIGGGLAGLAAAFLARAGRAVILYEKSRALGGRARTMERDGFALNLGPHALYRKGAGAPILEALGVRWTGRAPQQSGYGVVGGRLAPLPAGPRSFLTTKLLTGGAKRELLTLLPRLMRLDTDALRGVPLDTWIAGAIHHQELRQFMSMLIRTTTYTADSTRLSAGEALAQTRLGLLGNVDYLDGGWQTLIDSLRDAARRSGVRIVADTRVIAITRTVGSGAARGVRLDDGTTTDAAAVIAAIGPDTTAKLVADGPTTPPLAWAERAIPVEMACLNLGLRGLPIPTAKLTFGLDRPLYLSVHSAVARLAPAGGAVVHVGKYLRADERTTPDADRRELEGLLDLVQPGWRDQVVARSFMPRMTVMNALITAADGGLPGRPGPAVPGVPGLYVAGDWVGPTGMLADAALASAKQAVEQLLVAVPRHATALAS